MVPKEANYFSSVVNQPVMIFQHDQGSLFVPLVSFYSYRRGKMEKKNKQRKKSNKQLLFYIL